MIEIIDGSEVFVYNSLMYGKNDNSIYHIVTNESRIWREGNFMSEVKVKENESLDSALRRFKRTCAKDGIMGEVRKREHYHKPSVKRKKKSEAARKRKFK